MRKHHSVFVAAMALVVSAMRPAAQAPQAPDPANLQQQMEKISAMQVLLEKEMQIMMRQLEEIRTLLQARPVPSKPATPPLPTELTLDGATTRGASDSRLVIIEFSDFQCPFCGRFARDTFGQIDRDYVATGKVLYAFRHFPLESIHPQALKASEATACAGVQGKFWEMHERLFHNQSALMPSDLASLAVSLGVDPTAFSKCLAGQMTARVKQDLALGTRAGVNATPTFFIGLASPDNKVKVLRKLSGALSYAAFKAAIDQELAAATPAR